MTGTVPLFMPALVQLLLHAEAQKGTPLTQAEVEAMRDNAVVMLVAPDQAAKMAERRGFVDLDPQHVWMEWQEFRITQRR